MELNYVNLTSIVNSVMRDKTFSFASDEVNQHTFEMMLPSLSDDTSRGIDLLDETFFPIASGLLSKPICHIYNGCLLSGTCPELWKEAKIIPLPKVGKAGFTGSNFRPMEYYMC